MPETSQAEVQVSGKRLDDDYFLINAETVKHSKQVFPTTRHLPLHGQTEILLHSFGDSSSHCVVSGRGKRLFKKKINANIDMVRNRVL